MRGSHSQNGVSAAQNETTQTDACASYPSSGADAPPSPLGEGFRTVEDACPYKACVPFRLPRLRPSPHFTGGGEGGMPCDLTGGGHAAGKDTARKMRPRKAVDKAAQSLDGAGVHARCVLGGC